MRVKVRRIDKSLPLPNYGTNGSAGLDCFVRETTVIKSKELSYLPLNVCLKPPKNHFVLIAARSSLPKRGLFLANGIGIGDEDYCGDGDEYKAQVYNFTDKEVTIKKGDRVAQIIFLPYDKVEWNEVESLGNNNRGGFGTTGN